MQLHSRIKNWVWLSAKNFNMMTEINEIFDILDLCTHKLTGKLKRKYHKIADDDDEEMTFQWARKSSAFQ